MFASVVSPACTTCSRTSCQSAIVRSGRDGPQPQSYNAQSIADIHQALEASTSGRDSRGDTFVKPGKQHAYRHTPWNGAAADSSAWKSGYLSGADAEKFKYLDMAHMAAVYEETVFETFESNPASVRLNADIQRSLGSCKDLGEACSIVHRDAACMEPDTALKAMGTVSMQWQQQRQRLGSNAAEQLEPQGTGRTLFKGSIATPGSSASSNKQAVAAAMAVLVAQLVAELPKVRTPHVSAAMVRLGRVQYKPVDEVATSHIKALLQHCQPDLFLASPESLNRLVQGLGYMQLPQGALPQGWVQAFCKVAQSKFLLMNAQQLSRVAWGVASLGHLPDPFWLSGFLSSSRACMDKASPATLSNMAWALLQFNKLAMDDTKWQQEHQRLQRLAQGPLSGRPHWQVPGTVSISIAGEDWTEACWQVATALVPTMTSEQLVVLIHAMSFLGCKPGSATMAAVYESLAAKAGSLTPMQDCQVLGALARWEDRPSASFMACYTAHIQQRLPQFGPADLHLLLGPLSRLRFLPPRPWLAAWLMCARPKLRFFGPAGIVTVLKSFAFWQLCPPKEFMQDVLEVAAGLARAKVFKPGQLSRVIRGVMELRLELQLELGRPPRWSREVLTAFSGMVASASAADLAVVLFCLPHLLRPGRSKSAVAIAPAQAAAAATARSSVKSKGKQAASAMLSSSSGDTKDATPKHAGNAVEEAREGAPAAGAGAGPEAAPTGSSAAARKAAITRTLDPVVLQPVTTIVDAAMSLFNVMTGMQLHGITAGLAAVDFPASPAFMEAHARAVASRMSELNERQLDSIEKAYVSMRKAKQRASGETAHTGAGGASVVVHA